MQRINCLRLSLDSVLSASKGVVEKARMARQPTEQPGRQCDRGASLSPAWPWTAREGIMPGRRSEGSNSVVRSLQRRQARSLHSGVEGGPRKAGCSALPLGTPTDNRVYRLQTIDIHAWPSPTTYHFAWPPMKAVIARVNQDDLEKAAGKRVHVDLGDRQTRDFLEATWKQPWRKRS